MSIAYIWILIPLAGILSGSFRSWLRFKAEQERMGRSTRRLELELDQVLQEREKLTRRIENLEAIVTSRLWDSTRPDASGRERARLDIVLSEVPESLPARERARAVARTLGV